MSHCLFCQQQLKTNISFSFLFSWKKIEKHLLCIKCAKRFEKLTETSTCPGCSRPQQNQQLCKDCKKWQERYPRLTLKHTALYAYNEMARNYMDQYKFQGDILLAEVFYKEIHEALKNYQKSHLIVPVPISPLSKKTRGFNQVELLLKRAAITYHSLLENKSLNSLQSSKNRSQRLKTPQPFHFINEEILKESTKNKILIVDDVYTTGRTILHARVLFERNLPTHFKTESFSLFR